ncbi:MAG: hypothetical protein ABJB16_08925 [Saprospiraceae bacterium]
MKKTLLPALIISCIIIFARGQAPPVNLQLSFLHYSQNLHLKMDDADWISSSKAVREKPS